MGYLNQAECMTHLKAAFRLTREMLVPGNVDAHKPGMKVCVDG